VLEHSVVILQFSLLLGKKP